jgi:hypothetical protein
MANSAERGRREFVSAIKPLKDGDFRTCFLWLQKPQ